TYKRTVDFRPSSSRACKSRNDERPSLSISTTSPSITHSRAGKFFIVSTISEKRPDNSFSLRDSNDTFLSILTAIARIPSNLSSYIQSPAVGGFSVRRGFIGSMKRGVAEGRSGGDGPRL